MKDKDPNELITAEVTRSELDLLCGWYDEAVSEAVHLKSPVNVAQREANAARRDVLARMADGRYWNKGTGRKAKVGYPGPALPMENNPLIEPQAA